MDFTKKQIKDFYELAENHLEHDCDSGSCNEEEVEFELYGVTLLISGTCHTKDMSDPDVGYYGCEVTGIDIDELGIWNEKLEEWQTI